MVPTTNLCSKIDRDITAEVGSLNNKLKTLKCYFFKHCIILHKFIAD